MTLLLALVGLLIGRWLRDEWERWQDWRAFQAFPPPYIADPTAPTTTEILTGIEWHPQWHPLWGDGITPDPTRWRST